ncbi:excinuclease ABC subunit UvrA [Streptomyces sp. CMB-StM0423]|uniref:excinuclease ABC subunit UvrA n=1 Tax=Streptomyces sp. CMB-StM0423 TaxID=2059884 RepID=UPI000C704048|nr:excinuclease ABC subunit UvrA [Streptomyces sp. CMB-StM0423]AUH43745.1 daunorubicin resistance protein DrrC [Streptomyces sp. CMB-StM0423]
MAPQHIIRITGAGEHNLKNVSLDIPRDKITVFTGVSGSGKSSLVFDTLAVESQRQLGETFGWFVRNRLPRHERPHADGLANLTPAVVVDQRPLGGGARSTVGTATDVYAVLRVLFSRCAVPSAGEASAYSFNDPRGMCPGCDGLGKVVRLDLDRFLDRSRSLNEGAIRFAPFGVGSVWWQTYAESGLFDPDLPLARYGAREWELLLHGKGFRVPRRVKSTGADGHNAYEGLVERFGRLYLRRDVAALSGRTRAEVLRVVTEAPCPRCGGARLNEAALAGRIRGRNIAELAALEAGDLLAELKQLDDPVGGPVAAAAVSTLARLVGVGLGYLSLDRDTSTLSGGEGQRLKVVRQLGSSLTGLTYVFDEPSTGLHPRDVHRLTGLLRELRDKGNTVLVVEHDRDVIAIADHVVDMGPGAGTRGGEVVFAGPPAELAGADTPTGSRLGRTVPVRARVRTPTGFLPVEHVTAHNLRDVTVAFPLGVLTAVTGVAGSGKSTLVAEFVRRYEDGAGPDGRDDEAADAPPVAAAAEAPGSRVPVVVDQSAITGSSRSTPVTYLGAMDPLRRHFARVTGASAALFSFNSRGACATCRGRGVIVTDLAFMDPVSRRCEACGGRRFGAEALAHTVRGRSVADLLEMTAAQAADFLAAGGPEEARIAHLLAPLAEVGLGYVTLGQSVASLSGGERQRLKLAARLGRPGGVYVFDEPSAGLHMADVEGLIALLHRLVDGGGTVVVVEHDRDVVKHADWVVDLGPGGGRDGGRVLFEGTPAELARAAGSATAEYLRRDLAG